MVGLRYTSKKHLGQYFDFYVSRDDGRFYSLKQKGDNLEAEDDTGRTFHVDDKDAFRRDMIRVESPPEAIVGLIFSKMNGDSLKSKLFQIDDFD